MRARSLSNPFGGGGVFGFNVGALDQSLTREFNSSITICNFRDVHAAFRRQRCFGCANFRCTTGSDVAAPDKSSGTTE